MRILVVLFALSWAVPRAAVAIDGFVAVDAERRIEAPVLGEPLPPGFEVAPLEPTTTPSVGLLCPLYLPAVVESNYDIPLPEWPMSIVRDPYLPADPIPSWWWQPGEIPVRQVQ